MDVAVWTVLGVLAALSLGTLFYLGARIDGLGSSLNARIDALGTELRAAIERQSADLGARIDAQTARIDALNARMDEHLGRHAG